MDIPPKFVSKNIEKKWYSYWMENGFFRSTPDERDPYTIVIPPPNVTGVLHMGHMLNNTLQDIIIRRARMQGYNACWVPGTDHASIATEAKVVAKLKEQGKDPVLFGLSDKDYEFLSKNFAQIRAYMIKQRQVINEYKEYYEPETTKEE